MPLRSGTLMSIQLITTAMLAGHGAPERCRSCRRELNTQNVRQSWCDLEHVDIAQLAGLHTRPGQDENRAVAGAIRPQAMDPEVLSGADRRTVIFIARHKVLQSVKRRGPAGERRRFRPRLRNRHLARNACIAALPNELAQISGD